MSSETLGQFLKREREFRNLSLEDLSRISKINSRFLQAIEEDQFASLPPGAFIRGFLKTYARSVGLNIDEVLARYQTTQSTETPSGAAADPFQKFRRLQVKNQLVYVILFLIGVIALATYLSAR